MLRSRCNVSTLRSISNRLFSKTVKTASAKEVTKSSSDQSKDIIESTGRPGYDIEKIINLDNIRIVTKVQKKKPEREPLVKNFFVSTVDKDLLGYPQVIDYEDYDKFLQSLKPITDYFQNKVDYIDTENDIPKTIVSDLKRMKIFGSAVGELYGGIGHFKTESTLASESEAIDLNTFLFINRHRLVTEAIADHGTPEQRDRYLPDLAKGNLIGTVCFHALNPLEKVDGGISAEKVSDANGWTLNGSKSFVINSDNTNLLLVLANVKSSNSTEGSSDQEAMAFLVNKNQAGVTVTEEPETIGFNGIRKTTIQFSNVTVNNDDVLAKKAGDCDVIQKVVQSSRIQDGILSCIQFKKILNYLVEYVINTKYGTNKLMDMEYIKVHLGDLTSQLYQLESMIYLTVGLIDEYENPKVDFETAIIKAFSQDCLLAVTSLALNFMDERLPDNHLINQYIKDAIQLKLTGESNDTLKHYIGLNGALHCKENIGSKMKPYREKKGFFSQLYLFDKFEDPYSPMALIEHVHPSFDKYCLCLEHSILRLQMAVEMIFTRYRDDALNQTLHIMRLGEATMETYVMFASLARASRSYCIGLRYAKHETVFVAIACRNGNENIRHVLRKIRNEETEQVDSKYNKLTESVLFKKKYFLPPIVTNKQKS